jgi:hypothetical protein
MMWAVKHIQYCEMIANPELRKEKENEEEKQLSEEELEREFSEQKGKLQKVISSNKEKKKRKKGESEVPQKTEEEKKREQEGDGRMYTCTRLTGYQLLKMVQRAPKQITGGIMINNGVSKNLCKLAHNVPVKTEEIVEWDLDTAFISDPVYRPYQ